MFFGSPTTRDFQRESKTQIQILQNDVVYDKELKVSSLEGLQYLSRRMQILSSTYPNRDIKMSHMVSYNLRSHVIQAYTHCYTESRITGIEPTEIVLKFSKSWLGFDTVTFFGYLVRKGTFEMSIDRKTAYFQYSYAIKY
jgi:hypothetical protein